MIFTYGEIDLYASKMLSHLEICKMEVRLKFINGLCCNFNFLGDLMLKKQFVLMF